MLADPLFLGCLAVALAIIWAGRRIATRVDHMSINLGNGGNGIHEMVYSKLDSIEEELRQIRSTIEVVDFRVSEIEDHVKPPPEANPFELNPSQAPCG